MASPRSASAALRAVRSVLGSQVLKVFVVLTLSLMVFFGKSLTTAQYYAPGDVSGLSNLLQPPGAQRGKVPQIDATVDFLPWARFGRNEIQAGRLPLWNPYNNSGVPQLGNMQSAVFSPFKAPFYVRQMRLALFLSAYLILMTAGMFMYLLGRHLRLSFVAALGAAIAYMFCAYNVLWLRWPLASVAAFLPGIFWASSALIRADGWRRALRWGAMLAVLVALGIVAGHPETLLFGVIPAVGWCLAWLATSGLGWRSAGGRILRLMGAGVAAVALAAIQILPFLEYVAQSPASSSRGAQIFQSEAWMVVQVFPRFAGSPVMKYGGPYGYLRPFHEVTMIYVGAFALLLAVIAVASPRWTHRRAPLVFGGMCVAWVLYSYNMLGFGELVSKLPGMSLVMPSRSAIGWAFCVSVLAGFGIDGVRELGSRESARRWLAPTVLVAAATGVFCVMVFWAWRMNQTVAPPTRQRAIARATALQHFLFIGSWFFVGVALIVLLLLLRGQRVRQILCGGLLVVLFMQGGFLMRGENQSVAKDQFFTFPPAAQRVAKAVGNDQTLWVDGASMMPDLNLWYELHSPGNYDALGLQTYESLYRAVLRPPRRRAVGGADLGILDGPVHPVSATGLAAIGIRRVVSNRTYPLAENMANVTQAKVHTVSGDPTIDFQWWEGAPEELVIFTQGLPSGTRLEAVFSGDWKLTPQVRQLTTRGGLGVAAFPTGLPSDGQATVTIRRVGHAKGRNLAKLGIAAKAVTTPIPGLRLDQSSAGFQVYSVPKSAGLASSPTKATWVTTNAEALHRVTDPSFDPREQVVLEGRPGSDGAERGPATAGNVTVEGEIPGDLTIRVKRSTRGYLVVNQNKYPGWRATVNGRDRPVLRANSTFMAIPVPAGDSQVRLQFRPTSVRIGATLSIMALILTVIALLISWLPRRAVLVPQRTGAHDE